MKKETKIFILIVVISVALLTALDIQTKGKITGLVGSANPLSLRSSDVTYTKNSQFTVQGAINNLYNSYIENTSSPNRKDNQMYFEFGNPTTSSTTDYTTLNKNIFMALNGGQKSICVIMDSRLHCFDYKNYIIEKEHVKQLFPSHACSESESNINCGSSDYHFSLGSSGSLNIIVYGESYCYIFSEKNISCKDL